MELEQPQTPRRGRARERIAARQAKQMSVMPFGSGSARPDDFDAVVPVPPTQRGLRWARQRKPEAGFSVKSARDRLMLKLKDAWWYALHRPYVLRGVIAAGILLFVVYVLSHLATGRIFPNIWSLGVHLGEMTMTDAAAALQTAWANEVVIDLVDGDRNWQVRPLELGMSLDAVKTVENARGMGLVGFPLGYNVEPVVELDLFAAQAYLLELTERANFPAANAGFRWENDQLVVFEGSDGRVLDVGQTMDLLRQTATRVADTRELVLVTQVIPPESVDPLPYLAEARALASEPFTITGYDPFVDERLTWSTDRETFTSWLEVNTDGLGLREAEFSRFIEAQNRTLNPEGVNVRYLESTETMEKMEAAINTGEHDAELRVRYRQQPYEIVAGDTGYEIARKTGLPFYMLQTANPGLEWEQLSVGQEITMPSRDVTLPLDPVPDKRIIVNLDAQSMVAYENGQEVFRWLISSGTEEFPTYPGIYQILSHDETALGSTFELCGSSGCGQWEMYWFMGIYEVVPGLMNGFHGAVLLPNGAYLGGGNVGYPYTYGCVMSENSNAEALYHWADQGTVVEIISSDYPPQSELARQAFAPTASAQRT